MRFAMSEHEIYYVWRYTIRWRAKRYTKEKSVRLKRRQDCQVGHWRGTGYTEEQARLRTPGGTIGTLSRKTSHGREQRYTQEKTRLSTTGRKSVTLQRKALQWRETLLLSSSAKQSCGEQIVETVMWRKKMHSCFCLKQSISCTVQQHNLLTRASMIVRLKRLEQYHQYMQWR